MTEATENLRHWAMATVDLNALLAEQPWANPYRDEDAEYEIGGEG